MAIICGTDLSAFSNGALDVAVALAGQRGDDEVILAHVATGDAGTSAHAQLEAQAARITATPVAVRVRTEIIPGSVEESLASLADTEGADLIVIARSAGGGAKVGSTANAIISNAHVP